MSTTAGMAWRDSGRCTDCRACELACSYHHLQVFSPVAASIAVRRDSDAGNVTLTLDPSCDLCVGEATPLCVEFCYPGALTVADLTARRGAREEIGR